MEIQPTPNHIIASAIKLPFEQRAAIVNALVGTVQQDARDGEGLNRLLKNRVASAQ